MSKVLKVFLLIFVFIGLGCEKIEDPSTFEEYSLTIEPSSIKLVKGGSAASINNLTNYNSTSSYDEYSFKLDWDTANPNLYYTTDLVNPNSKGRYLSSNISVDEYSTDSELHLKIYDDIEDGEGVRVSLISGGVIVNEILLEYEGEEVQETPFKESGCKYLIAVKDEIYAIKDNEDALLIGSSYDGNYITEIEISNDLESIMYSTQSGVFIKYITENSDVKLASYQADFLNIDDYTASESNAKVYAIYNDALYTFNPNKENDYPLLVKSLASNDYYIDYKFFSYDIINEQSFYVFMNNYYQDYSFQITVEDKNSSSTYAVNYDSEYFYNHNDYPRYLFNYHDVGCFSKDGEYVYYVDGSRLFEFNIQSNKLRTVSNLYDQYVEDALDLKINDAGTKITYVLQSSSNDYGNEVIEVDVISGKAITIIDVDRGYVGAHCHF